MATLGLRRWIKSAPSGQTLIYHRGFLMVDRQDANAPHPYDTIGKVMWHAMQRGEVYLVQRKLGEASYEYLAIHA